jgi:uncharacterized protein YbaP (TraB family)
MMARTGPFGGGCSGRRSSAFRSAVAVLLLLLAGGSVDTAEPPERSFLWRVRSDTTTVHILGSIHLMKPDDYPLSDAIEHAFAGADTVVFEVDLDQLTGAALKLLAAGSLANGQRLRDEVPEETWKLVESRLVDLGMNVEGVQSMRPWLLAVSITSAELARAGYAQTAGVDLHYFDRAKAAGKRRLALESIDFQVGLFANLSREEDAEFLQYTLDELDTLIPTVDQLMAHWRSGHVAEVEALLTDAYREFPDLFRRLVSDRNRSWLPQIEALLAGDGSAMVVVGALHLVGEQGLVEQLRQRGFAVEQL